jgi:hypothetical protein
MMMLDLMAAFVPDANSKVTRPFDVELLKLLTARFSGISKVETLLNKYCTAANCDSIDLFIAKSFLIFMRREDSELYYSFRRNFIEVYLQAQPREYIKRSPLYCANEPVILPEINYDLLIPVFESKTILSR